MRKRTVAVVVTGVALLAGVAFAGVAASKKAERARQYVSWKVDDAMDGIDATDPQRKLADQLTDRLFDEGLKLRETKGSVRDGLVAEFKKDRADPNTVHALVDRMFDDVRAFAHKAADAAIQFHATLSKEQKQALLERYEERRSRWEH